MLHQANDYTIEAPDYLIGAADIENLIMIDSSDAILITDNDSDKYVKYICSVLKIIRHDASALHLRRIYLIIEAYAGF